MYGFTGYNAFRCGWIGRTGRRREGSRTMRAAAPHETGREKLEVLDDVEAVGFGPGKVRLRIRAAGPEIGRPTGRPRTRAGPRGAVRRGGPPFPR